MEKVLKGDGSNTHAFYFIGCILHRQKRYDQEIRIIKNILTMNPQFKKAGELLKLLEKEKKQSRQTRLMPPE